MKVSPTGRFRKGVKSVPVRLSFTVTVLSFTNEPIPPSRSKLSASAVLTSGPYPRQETMATLASPRREAGILGVGSAADKDRAAQSRARGVPAARARVRLRKARRLKFVAFIGLWLLTMAQFL